MGNADRPTASQRRILESLATGAVIRMPPWGKQVQLVAVGQAGQHVAERTLRVLLRHAWIEREAGSNSQVPTYRLSEQGRTALAASLEHETQKTARRHAAEQRAAGRRAAWSGGGQGTTRPT